MSSADAATISAQNLVEALQIPSPNAPFATINDKYNKLLRSLSEQSDIIPKASEQQSTNRHNVQ